VKKKLVIGEFEVLLVRKDNPVGAFFQSPLELSPLLEVTKEEYKPRVDNSREE
jgi:hypothetical protein